MQFKGAIEIFGQSLSMYLLESCIIKIFIKIKHGQILSWVGFCGSRASNRSTEGVLSEDTCHGDREIGGGQENKAAINKWFQEHSSFSLISPAAPQAKLHSDGPEIEDCSQAAPISQEQSSRRGSGMSRQQPALTAGNGYTNLPSLSVPSPRKNVLSLLTLHSTCLQQVFS